MNAPEDPFEHHVRARAAARVIYQRTSDRMATGVPASKIRRELTASFERYRAAGDSVMRDAFAEVLDWFEGERMAQSAP